jgi:laminin alpha 3/5
LIIQEEVAGGQEKKYVNELVLSGTFSIFNLDQELSKLFVGGFPVYFGIQPEIKYQAFEGQIEELVIGDTPVSLWNFVSAENNVGAIER